MLPGASTSNIAKFTVALLLPILAGLPPALSQPEVGAASGQPEEYFPFADIAAMIFVLKQCPEFKQNTPALKEHMGSYGIVMEEIKPGGKFFKDFDYTGKKAIAGIVAKFPSKEAMCESADKSVFGPGGLYQSNLIMRK